MGLSRILKKVNKAKQAISSLKGIASKLQNMGYNSVINSDELKSQAEEATKKLDKRRKSLQKNLDAKQTAKNAAKDIPVGEVKELMYPIGDPLENYILFTTRPRRARAKTRAGVNVNLSPLPGTTTLFKKDDANRQNLLSKESVEIALYVPDELTSTADVKYKTGEVGSFMRGMQSGEGVGGFVEGLISGVTQGVQKFMNSMSGDAMFFMQGKAVNPQQEQMLEGVDFRSFTFNYTFWPKSEKEAQMVNQIIYWFRTAMLPDTYPPIGGGGQSAGEAAGGGEAFFNYPNIFDVEYFGPIKDKVDGFLPMVCTSVSVNHTNGKKFATYKDGQPISSSMSLSFLEIKILTQESYQEITASSSGAKSGLRSADSILDKNTKDAAAAAEAANMGSQAESAAAAALNKKAQPPG
jgi:hypothetical protein